jgi:hypothetical protein
MPASFSVEETKELISLYQNYPVLWKVDHVDYGKRGPRYAALKRITSAMPGRDELIILIQVPVTLLFTVALNTKLNVRV